MGRAHHWQQSPGLIDTLYGQEKWLETIVAYQTAATINPNYYSDYLGLGRSLANLGHTGEAKIVFDAIAQSGTTDVTNVTHGFAIRNSYIEMAKTLEKEGQLEDAEAWYTVSIQYFSTGYRELISLLEEQGRLEDAEILAATMPKPNPPLLNLVPPRTTPQLPTLALPPSIQNMSTRDRNPASDQYINKAESLYAQQRYEEAEVAFRQALCFSSPQVTSIDYKTDYETSTRARLGAGDSLYRRGLRVAAREIYKDIYFEDKGVPSICELREILLSRELFSTMEEVEAVLYEEPNESCS